MSSYRDTIQGVIDNQTVETVLRKGSGSAYVIKALQHILHELGYSKQLDWENYGADGDYGAGTTNAIKSFTDQNGLGGNGEVVTENIARKLLARYDIVDDLRHVYDAIKDDKVEQFYYRGSPHTEAVVALQTTLNELGFGKELNWAKYGADGDYGTGTVNALKVFAQKEGIPSDGTKLSKELAQRIVDKFKNYYGDNWTIEIVTPEIVKTNVIVQETVEGGKTRVYVDNGASKARFTKFKKGIYTYGVQKAIDFVKSNRSDLNNLGLTDSALNVMVAVSENEGNLDAINTWDNSFMTFGMFQWTIGVHTDPGELAALIKKIKDKNVNIYLKYYGQYGLDVMNAGRISGYFVLNGQKLDTPQEKELLRNNEWAFYFWLSGQDPLVQSIEIEHALSRINTFYHRSSYKVGNYYISDLITSEYGVGLILDNHVNRPGYVKGCLKEAMTKTGLSNPHTWRTDEERKLINAYLKIRETYGRSPSDPRRQTGCYHQKIPR